MYCPASHPLGGPMTSYPNPALRSVALRTLGPFLPVWLSGLVLGLLLDRLGPTGTLDEVEVIAFLAFYTLLSWAMVVGLFLRQVPEHAGVSGDRRPGDRRSRPSSRGTAPDGRRLLNIPYGQISALSGGGLTGWRIEGRPEGAGRLDWINLTEENAGRIADALDSWRRREAPEPPGSPATG